MTGRALTLAELLEPYVRGLHVAYQRICPVTGCGLHVHTAVVMRHSDGRVLLLLSPEGWRRKGPEILARLQAEHGDIIVVNAPEVAAVHEQRRAA